MQRETNLERIIVFILFDNRTRVLLQVDVAFAVQCVLFVAWMYTINNAMLMSAVPTEQWTVSRNIRRFLWFS